MDAAEAGEGGIFKAGYHFENSGLCAVLHLGLKADHVEKRAKLVVLTQLHDGVGLDVGGVGVGQAAGLHRAVTQGFGAAFGHDLDRQAAVEIAGGFAFVKFGFVGVSKGFDEGVVLLAGHRAVHVGGLFRDGFALVVAALHPGHGHVHGIGIDDGSDGVEEGEAFGAGRGADAGGKRRRGQRAGGDDPAAS